MRTSFKKGKEIFSKKLLEIWHLTHKGYLSGGFVRGGFGRGIVSGDVYSDTVKELRLGWR